MLKSTLTAALAVSLFAAANVQAAGSSSSSSSSSARQDNYSSAVSEVKNRNYNRALRLLRKVVARSPDNADAWNYMGFSHRKLGQYDDSLAAYRKALAIDPGHLGANEYLGELYVQTGKLAMAKARLEKLRDLCGTDCEEYQDLKLAINAQ